MRKIKYLIFTILVLALSTIFSLNVFGASKYSMQINGSSTATKGSNIALTFKASNVSSLSGGFAGYSGNITYDSTKLEYVSATGIVDDWDFGKTQTPGTIIFMGYDNFSPANTKRADTDIFKVTFKVLNDASGNTTITATNIKGTTETGVSLTADPVSKTITITEPTASKSSNANLSNLSVDGYSISPSFNSNTQSYSVTVPSDVTSVNINALVADSTATKTVTGNNNLSVGKNTVLVEVRAEDGNKKIYKIEVTRSAPASTTTKSNNNNLKEISGIPGLEFDPNKTEYDVILPFEVNSLNVTATAEDSKSKITYSNSNLKDLTIGKTNTITIAVTAEDSSVKIYTINVKRSPYESETDLKELVVNKEDIYKEGEDNYKVTVSSDTNTLDISAIPKTEGSTVKIIGGDNLKAGNNTVVVEVTDKNGFKKSYTLNVEKKTNSFLFDFLKDWWLLLLAMLFILIILFILIYLHERNKKLLEDINNEARYISANNANHNNVIYVPEKEENTKNPEPTHIDNTYNILYNSNNNNTIAGSDVETYIPKHLDDDSIKEIEKKIKVIRDELYDEKPLEEEYKIIEKYRKK